MNRRGLLTRLGSGLLAGTVSGASGLLTRALSAAELAERQADQELMMLIWCAHTLPTRERFSAETVRGWIRLCGELGVTTILWRGSYVGKATYHVTVHGTGL